MAMQRWTLQTRSGRNEMIQRICDAQGFYSIQKRLHFVQQELGVEEYRLLPDVPTL